MVRLALRKLLRRLANRLDLAVVDRHGHERLEAKVREAEKQVARLVVVNAELAVKLQRRGG